MFAGCSSLKKVTFPASVTEIRRDSLTGCSSLEKWTVLATAPPNLSSLAGQSTIPPIIYVPASAVDAYKSAPNWSAYADRIFAIQE